MSFVSFVDTDLRARGAEAALGRPAGSKGTLSTDIRRNVRSAKVDGGSGPMAAPPGVDLAGTRLVRQDNSGVVDWC